MFAREWEGSGTVYVCLKRVSSRKHRAHSVSRSVPRRTHTLCGLCGGDKGVCKGACACLRGRCVHPYMLSRTHAQRTHALANTHTLLFCVCKNVCVFARETNAHPYLPHKHPNTHTHSYFEFARKCVRVCAGDNYTHSLAHTHNTHIPSQTRTHPYFPRKHTHTLLSLTNSRISHAHARVSIAKTHTLTSPANTHTRVFPSLLRTHLYFHRKYAHVLLSLAHTLISPAQTQTHSLADMQTHTSSR